MAKKDYTQPSPEQMKVAFHEIASMAMSLRSLCYLDVDGNNHAVVISMAANIASQIGWVADRCVGFENDTPDGWLLPPIWETKESEVHHD